MLKASPISPLIVFTTAYDEYAVEAFGLNAIDYLLKPYSHMRLKETLREYARVHEASPKSRKLMMSPTGVSFHRGAPQYARQVAIR